MLNLMRLHYLKHRKLFLTLFAIPVLALLVSGIKYEHDYLEINVFKLFLSSLVNHTEFIVLATLIPIGLYFLFFEKILGKELKESLTILPIKSTHIVTARYLYYFLLIIVLLSLFTFVILYFLPDLNRYDLQSTINDIHFMNYFHSASIMVFFEIAKLFSSVLICLGIGLFIIPNYRIKYRGLWAIGIYLAFHIVSVPFSIVTINLLPTMHKVALTNNTIEHYLSHIVIIISIGILFYVCSYILSLLRISKTKKATLSC